MQIPAISNTQTNNQNFQGQLNIVNDLSYLPCKYTRAAYDEMSKIIKDKPFDLFIRQNHKENTLSFIAKKTEHLGKKNKPFVENIITNISTMDNGKYTTDLYKSVAEDTVNTYDKTYPTKNKNEKIKNFINKFIEIFQDKDEI